MRFFMKFTLLNLLLAICFSANAADKLQIKDAWIPEMPPVSRVMAGFASFVNPTAQNLEIVSITSPDFERVEMHLSEEVGGMARMIPQKSLIVQANKHLDLKHGSYHLMLFNPAKRFLAGDKINMQLTLSNGQTQSWQAEVRSSMGHGEHEHHHHHSH